MIYYYYLVFIWENVLSLLRGDHRKDIIPMSMSPIHI